MGDPDNDDASMVSCMATAQFLNPKRFKVLSIESLWAAETISRCMSLFTELRALRVVDHLFYDLDKGTFRPSTRHSGTFPFSSALINAKNTSDDDKLKLTPMLEVLWLVQHDRDMEYQPPQSFSSWCEVVLSQLRETFRHCNWMAAGTKPIQTIRVEYLDDILFEEYPWQTPFSEFADAVEWRIGKAGSVLVWRE